MRFPRVRLTVRRMMIAVAIVASCIGGFRWAALSLEDFTYYGPYIVSPVQNFLQLPNGTGHGTPW